MCYLRAVLLYRVKMHSSQIFIDEPTHTISHENSDHMTPAGRMNIVSKQPTKTVYCQVWFSVNNITSEYERILYFNEITFD